MYRRDAMQEGKDWPCEDGMYTSRGVLVHVPSGYIQSYQDVVFSRIDEAVPFAADQEQIKRLCLEGMMGVYLSYDDRQQIEGMMILQLMESPEEKVLRVVVMWGDLQEKWADFWPSLKQLARHIGASAIEGFGRKGFERWGKAEGLKPVYTLYRAEVE